MSELFVPQAGAVLSADIAVPDHDRETRFYSRVLTTGADPLWQDDLMNNQGIPVIGLGPRSEAHSSLPLQWMPHVQVVDVAASVARALELGGSVLMKDEAGGNQWAVLRDPNGAAFGIIPVVPADRVQENDAKDQTPNVGRILWLDLTVDDASATRDFYAEVVGWSVQDVAMTDGDAAYADYNMLAVDGSPAAGICHARGVNTGLPAVWMIYLPVRDLGESIRRVSEEGGQVIKEMRDGNDNYVYAAIQDPVGVSLALTQA